MLHLICLVHNHVAFVYAEFRTCKGTDSTRYSGRVDE